VERCAACVLLYSRHHHQVWSVGDSQALVDGQLYCRSKASDDLLANVRAFFLETELLLGKTIEELQENDTGRAFITPLLKRDRLFQNNPAHPEYESWVMDGFLDPALGVVVTDIQELTEYLVLASDGYPEVFSTLDETEKRLAEILARDPLLFREFKSTKGFQKGQISFDDRSYLRLRLHDPNRD
jgi:glycerophosphoryl diester phosphodiesterase